MGMILAAKADHTLNCINMPPVRRIGRGTAPAAAQPAHPEGTPAHPAGQEAPAPVEPQPETVRETPEPKREEETGNSPVDPKIAPTDGDEFEGTVFGKPEDDGNGKKPKTPKQKKDSSQRFVWIKRVGKKIEEGVGSIFDDIKEEEV